MATPDVRVRLSTEGVQDVLAALKKIQAEGAAAGAGGAKSFGSMNSVLRSTRNLLATLGVALSVGALVSYAVKTSEVTERTGDMAQSLGTTVEKFSALRQGAIDANVPAQKFEQSMGTLVDRLDGLRAGEAAATQLFRRLGLTLDDFNGKDTADSLELIARRLVGLKDPNERAGAAVAFFGKRVALELMPFIRELSEKGIPALIERARELGVLLSGEAVAAAKRFNDTLDDLRAKSQSLAQQFITGLAPAVGQLATAMTQDLGGTGSAFKRFGEATGFVLKGLVFLIDLIIFGVGQVAHAATGATVTLLALARLDLAEARALAKYTDNVLKQEREAFASRTAALFAPPKPLEIKPPEKTEPTDHAAAARAQLATARAAADDRLKLLQASLKNEREAQDQLLEQGLRSYREHFAQRRAIQQEGFAAELRALAARRRAEAADEDPAKAATGVASVDAAIAVKKIEQAQAERALAVEEQQAAEKTAQVQLAALNKVRELRGQHHQVAIAEIEEVGRKFELALLQGGFSEELARVERQSLEGQARAGADFEEQTRQSAAALGEFDAEQARIQSRINAGLLSQVAGEQQLLALARDRLSKLQEIAAATLAAAQATGNAEQIASAQALAAAVAEIGLSLERADNSSARLTASLQDIGASGLTDFLATWTTGTRGLTDAFLSLAQSIQRVIAELVVAKLLGLIAGGVSAGSGSGSFHGQPSRMATGGLIKGPGTGTSDSIPARLSNLEYVEPAHVVRRPGVLSFLEALRKKDKAALDLVDQHRRGGGSPKRLAGGGLVTGPGTSAGESHPLRADQVAERRFAFEDAQSVEQTTKIRIDVIRAIHEARGYDYEHVATLEEITTHARRFEEALVRLGTSREVARVERLDFEEQLRATSDFIERSSQAEASLLSFDVTRAEIEERISAGLISRVSSEEQILKLERQRLGSLGEIATHLAAAAEATRNPDQLLTTLFGSRIQQGVAPSLAQRRAAGGVVTGPGTGISDSIPAWLSTGEFIVREAIVRRPGILDHLRKLNRGAPLLPEIRPIRQSLPHFAEGGLVGGGRASGGSLNGHLTVGLADGLEARDPAQFIKSPDGRRLIVEVINSQRRALGMPKGGR